MAFWQERTKRSLQTWEDRMTPFGRRPLARPVDKSVFRPFGGPDDGLSESRVKPVDKFSSSTQALFISLSTDRISLPWRSPNKQERSRWCKNRGNWLWIGAMKPVCRSMPLHLYSYDATVQRAPDCRRLSLMHLYQSPTTAQAAFIPSSALLASTSAP
jgi:hypothetical protein